MTAIKNRPTWIWYPGDYEIWLHQKASVLRQFRGYICPPSWRLDAAYTSVKFRRTYELAEPTELTVSAQGDYVLLLDDDMTPLRRANQPISSVILPAGRHTLSVNVYSDREIPALYASGAGCDSGEGWEVTALNGKWVPVASWTFQDISLPPAAFPFAYEEREPAALEAVEGGTLADFGRETFGHVEFRGVTGQGRIYLYYGESREEAMAGELAETFDTLSVNGDLAGGTSRDWRTPVTRAFRYIQLKADEGVSWESVVHHYEYLPMKRRGEFRSSDARLNDIWELSEHTLQMNMREFLYDGMKRDRWVWSGDANLGFLLNNYSFFEQDVAKRTLIGLRGKNPVEIHINTIMDYTFYWFLSCRDYYLYTGDLEFVRARYADMLSLMEFCLGRRNEEGMMEGYPEDWIFIDWAPMERRGALAAEQLMLCRSLETVAEFAQALGDGERAPRYGDAAAELRERIFATFWDEESGAFLHGKLNGELVRDVLKYPSLFALRFGYLNDDRREAVKRNVILNDGIQKIVTPFMRFFELEAMCELGETERVLREIRDYWGGMMDLGATAFWEEYDPELPPELQYDMYHDKYRKSLCHAWGAAPIYLLGKYVLGVRPTEPGYARYRVEPHTAGLDRIEGSVPTPNGDIAVYRDASRIRVTTCGAGVGTLVFSCDGTPRTKDGPLVPVSEGRYELELAQPDTNYEVLLA
ncbi:MGH1-like glycoside hydrolase domain-containing protein [Cohnella phaseoli]|uniref:Alpha-L-rhamnosidase-like protein n=1 Tax=Cohnella phaseoli TaxID=456490 RepID=A0A3D9HT74_9BACL|nr:family 78 glycoside hydrolase catalytic domain [Cohnella phaseoli]RED52649.1 alpha-L-rhamnosidase-like protein [Cohnella phaseoli]